MQNPAVRNAIDRGVWAQVAEDRAFCRSRARKLVDDPGTPGDIKLRTLERINSWADAAEERQEKRRAAAMAAGTVPDNADEEEVGEFADLLAALGANRATIASQITGKAQ